MGAVLQVQKTGLFALGGSRKFAVFERLPSFNKQRMIPKKQSTRSFN
jgi:hypothetical protein